MAEIKEISPNEVEQMMNQENIVVIDVREDEEVAQGKIKQAKHIKLGNIPEAVSELDKDKEYIMVCRSGARSMKASMFMDEQGFKVLNMKGGMLNWEGDTDI
ncbi:rhodanese-like domain-containing protein [Oceanobacillus massiliensis]|uniref:rhodanese-like domain-containing protein n=1 Tax=Oceanobacillus massiliensis TaxID=1465765 RepID=UPI00301A0ED7